MTDSRRKYLQSLEELKTVPVISEELWASFCKAYVYNSATPLSWLTANLAVLYVRVVLKGGCVRIENREKTTLTRDNFAEFLSEFFPDIEIEDIENKLPELKILGV